MWRVSLREARPEDGVAVDPWLSEALAAVFGRSLNTPEPAHLDQLLASLSDDQRLYLIIVAGERPAGVLICSQRDEGIATIDVLSMAASERNLGLGGEAVYALEDLAPDASYVAGVPLANGLAIYFWLRIGYRPLFPKPDPQLLDPLRTWIVRCPGESISARQ
jgi:hypothetical protein